VESSRDWSDGGGFKKDEAVWDGILKTYRSKNTFVALFEKVKWQNPVNHSNGVISPLSRKT
jgi:hypothetical protein